MAIGLVPVVWDDGAPSERVSSQTDYATATYEQRVETVLEEPQQVRVKRVLACQRVIENFTLKSK